MTPDLIRTQKTIAEVLVVVNTKKAAADIERDVVSKEAAAAGIQEAEAEELRQEAQAQLDEAAPMLDEAAKVVKTLDKGELYTLKSINTYHYCSEDDGAVLPHVWIQGQEG